MGARTTAVKSAALAALLHCAPGWSQEPITVNESPYARHFDAWRGCALVLHRDRFDQSFVEHGQNQCAERLPPCSTFKIPNALIGLQTGVVTGPDDLKRWDGTDKGRQPWNQDHTLASAMRVSAFWYFQALARDVGEPQMSDWLARLEYGNQDLSAGIDRFWLGSTLTVNSHEQLRLLRALHRSALPFDIEVQAQVRHMLLQDESITGALNGELYGKTGSCLADPETHRPPIGWYVGWLDAGSQRNPATTWFVVNIQGDGATGFKARDIAIALLEQTQKEP